MSKLLSFERINYSLRPNKAAERKILVEGLNLASTKFAISEYKYVGFGSIWFADFTLFHRMLNIRNMVSIEKERSRERRVLFNRPLKCIEIKIGHSSEVLPQILSTEQQTIVWLDYDGILEDGLTNGDMETALSVLPRGSIFIVTVNASIDQLRGKKVGDDRVLSEDAYINAIAGEYLPADYELNRASFPRLVGAILSNAMHSVALNSRDGERFEQIWNLTYADGSPMVTVGGMIVGDEEANKLHESGLMASEYVSPRGQPQKEISLPILTLKEKLLIDRLLPTDQPLRLRDIEFELKQTELEAYQALYRYFPAYGEIYL